MSLACGHADRRPAAGPRHGPPVRCARTGADGRRTRPCPRFPREAFAGMGELGLLGMTVPAEFDGAGADHVSYALAIMEIAAADGASSTTFQVHNSLVCLPLLRHGTPSRRNASCARSRAASCSAPSASPSRAPAPTPPRSRRAPSVRQQFCPQRHQAVHHLRPQRRHRARLRGDRPRRRQAGHFGLHRADQDARLHRGAGRAHDGPARLRHCQIVFEDCEVLPDQMLGEEGEGLKIALGNLEGGRIGVAAQSVGMARAAYDAPSPTPSSAAPSASRSSSTRRSPSGSPTWRPAAGGRADGAARRAPARRGQALPQGGVDGQAVRLRDGGDGSARPRSRSTAATAISTTSRSSASIATCASPDLRGHVRDPAPGDRPRTRPREPASRE